MNEVFIYDAVRTPRGRGRSDGGLNEVRPIDLVKTVLVAIRERNQLDTSFVDDVILGCVTPVGEQGGCIARGAALYAGYDEKVCGVSINRFCASGLDAINQAASNVLGGYCDLVVAGGVESMSRVPMGSDGGPWIIDPDVTDKASFVFQGISADLIATMEGFSRADLDEFALQSQKKAAAAVEKGYFNRSLISVRDLCGKVLLERDEYPRPETTIESLGKLKPAFEEMGRKYGFDAVAILKYPMVERIIHSHHAGNSSGIVDGAAAVLIGSSEIGKKLGLKPRARIKSMAMTAAEPTIMLTAPAPASKKALLKAGLTAKDIDLYEVNEAFAAVVLKFQKDMGLSGENINVNGGAIALGHPLGATGAMLVGTIIDELERRKQRYGLVTLCVGGGMGVATIIERVEA